MGSAPVSPGLFDAVRRGFPGAAISNGYGTTEAGPIVFAPHPRGLPTPLCRSAALIRRSSCGWSGGS